MEKNKRIISIIIILIVVFVAIFAINLNKTNEGTLEQPDNQTEQTNNNLTEEELINIVNDKVKEDTKKYIEVKTTSDVIVNNSSNFTIRYSIYADENNNEPEYNFYNIDKNSGKIFVLSDLFKDEGYKYAINQEIKNQMQHKMQDDKNLEFWLAEEGNGSVGFASISDNQNFYIAENGNIVIVFNKYEVAPGYMGVQEFEISKEVYKDYLK